MTPEQFTEWLDNEVDKFSPIPERKKGISEKTWDFIILQAGTERVAYELGATAAYNLLSGDDGWIKVEDGLPKCHIQKSSKRFINWVLGCNDKNKFICVYTKGHELEYGDDDPLEEEPDEVEERNGCLYLKPGWYELEDTPRGDYDETWVKRNPTHWRPLPEAPTVKK